MAVERKIVVDGDTARIEHGNRALDAQRFEDVEGVIVVHLDEIVPSDGEAICVVKFKNAYWVVPSLSAGSAPFFDLLLSAVKAGNLAIKQCGLNQMPWGWRMKLWGFLPLFPDADLGAHALSSLPSWQGDKVISVKEFADAMR